MIERLDSVLERGLPERNVQHVRRGASGGPVVRKLGLVQQATAADLGFAEFADINRRSDPCPGRAGLERRKASVTGH